MCLVNVGLQDDAMILFISELLNELPSMVGLRDLPRSSRQHLQRSCLRRISR